MKTARLSAPFATYSSDPHMSTITDSISWIHDDMWRKRYNRVQSVGAYAPVDRDGQQLQMRFLRRFGVEEQVCSIASATAVAWAA
jgi:hypothetical protein